jgi:hypothetical protein
MTAVAAVAAVVMAVVAVGGLPARQSPHRPPAAVSLVAFSMPVFPLALDPAPAGLKAPSFSAEGGRFLAVYLGTDGKSDVYLSVFDRHPEQRGTTRPVTVDGQRGELLESRPQGGPPLRR